MRAISADLLARIQELNQSIYKNADPKMYATITNIKNSLQVYTLATNEFLGTIDVAVKWEDLDSDPNEVWIAEIIDKQVVIKIYTYSQTMNFASPTTVFTLTAIGANARARDVAIEFDGIFINGQLQTAGSPYIAWLERTVSYDTGYIIQWNGSGVQPVATELLKIARI